ncbi:MAG TPA: hypothetical protein VHX13_13675 [Acidobacteriaceae bacterium]|jgi:hypothetical protein|nr:hypothetical protein [Acidobacteriaceae bacterium]
MNPSVKTTHVIPSQLPPVRVVGKLSTFLVCRYCMGTIGGYRTPAERLRLEARHLCPEKMALGRPAASIPFN